MTKRAARSTNYLDEPFPNAKCETTDMTELPTLPIIIGITGKRNLRGRDTAIRRMLGAAFDLLDQSLPASKKLLLSALASGADTLAAEEALCRKDWSVVAVLPLELELYAEDFDEGGADRLRRLAATPGVKTITLTPLTDPRSGNALSPAALARLPGKSNADRSDHYEQVGLFIAERCALLIAVMDAGERPDRVGGTARIVDYRLRGMPDEHARRVIARSRELRFELGLDHPQTGPLWLFDLATAGEDPNPLRAIGLWRARKGGSLSTNSVASFASRWLGLSSRSGDEVVEVEKIEWRHERELVAHVRLLERLEAFNQLAGETRSQARITPAGAATPSHDWSSALRGIRQAISAIQGRKKQLHTRAVYGLGTLFVAAVLVLELHIEFRWSIVPYLILLAAILGVYLWARWTLIQQFVEDYRAVSEALRVQGVWWDSGMVGRDYCVENHYLVGTIGSLAMVRAAVRNAIVAAELQYAPPPPAPSAADKWIDEQIKYFRSNVGRRELRLSWLDDAVWFFFIASAGMAVILFAAAPTAALDNAVRSLFMASTGMAATLLETARTVAPSGDWLIAHPVIGVAMMLGLMIANRVLSLRSKLARGRNVRLGSIVLGSLAAFLWGAWAAAVLFQLGESHHAGHKLVAVAAVVMASLAGAVRFFVERLGWEPELHSYREALETFRRARYELARLGAPAAIKERERLIFELGRFALEENESWIRAHRVRPIEPMH